MGVAGDTMTNEYAQAYAKIGALYGNLNWHDKAADAFRKSLSYDATSSQTLFLLGNAYEKMGRIREAVAAYNAVLRNDPHHREAKMRRQSLLPKAKPMSKTMSSPVRVAA
jgi:tetratricopeptide (TPR) repeat protein